MHLKSINILLLNIVLAFDTDNKKQKNQRNIILSHIKFKVLTFSGRKLWYFNKIKYEILSLSNLFISNL